MSRCRRNEPFEFEGAAEEWAGRQRRGCDWLLPQVSQPAGTVRDGGGGDNIQQALWSPLSATGTRILHLTGPSMSNHSYAFTYLPARPTTTNTPPPPPPSLSLSPMACTTPHPLISTPLHILYSTLGHLTYLTPLYTVTHCLMFQSDVENCPALFDFLFDITLHSIVEVMFVCWLVCLFVSKITQNNWMEFPWTLMEGYGPRKNPLSLGAYLGIISSLSLTSWDFHWFPRK